MLLYIRRCVTLLAYFDTHTLGLLEILLHQFNQNIFTCSHEEKNLVTETMARGQQIQLNYVNAVNGTMDESEGKE